MASIIKSDLRTQKFKLSDYDDKKKICEAIVKAAHEYFPELKKKIKFTFFSTCLRT